jgi:hypothetical protein
MQACTAKTFQTCFLSLSLSVLPISFTIFDLDIFNIMLMCYSKCKKMLVICYICSITSLLKLHYGLYHMCISLCRCVDFFPDIVYEVQIWWSDDFTFLLGKRNNFGHPHSYSFHVWSPYPPTMCCWVLSLISMHEP